MQWEQTAVHAIVAHGGQDGRACVGGELLVGVEDEDPVPGRRLETRVSGRGEVVVPGTMDHRGAAFGGDGDGVVGAAGVHHDELVG